MDMRDFLMNYGPNRGDQNNMSMMPGQSPSLLPNLMGPAPITQSMPTTVNPGPGMFGGMFDNFLGKTDKNNVRTDGWGNTALGVLGGLGSAYMGMQQYGLAKKTLQENKRQFNLNYDAQKSMTNSALEDRQRARVASNSSAYESPSSYMHRYGVK